MLGAVAESAPGDASRPIGAFTIHLMSGAAGFPLLAWSAIFARRALAHGQRNSPHSGVPLTEGPNDKTATDRSRPAPCPELAYRRARSGGTADRRGPSPHRRRVH